MAGIRKFEDIEAWQKARVLTREVYKVSAEGAFKRDWGLQDQIRRTAVSIMSNIAEGFGRGGNKEFAHMLTIAKGSASEVQAQLYVALDAGYLSQQGFQQLYQATDVTSKLITGLICYLQSTDIKGPKYRTDNA